MKTKVFLSTLILFTGCSHYSERFTYIDPASGNTNHVVHVSHHTFMTYGQAAALIDISSSWTKLRVGCRVSLTDSGTDIIGGATIFLGLLASPSAVEWLTDRITPNTSHFAGIMAQENTWSRNTNSYQTGGTVVGTRVGNVDATSEDTDDLFLPLAPASVRGMMILEFVRTNAADTTWEFNIITPGNDAGCLVDVTQAQFIAIMEENSLTFGNYATTVLGGSYGSGIGLINRVVSVNEATNGILNAVCVGWTRSDPLVEFSDVAYIELA